MRDRKIMGPDHRSKAESGPLPPKAWQQPERLEFIDGIRALCALFVLLCHAWFQPSNGYYAEAWMNHLGLGYGHLAVVVFIIVSGLVITLPMTKRGDQVGSVWGFYRRRVRRIVPPYYAALVFSIVFILVTGQEPTGTVWDTSIPLTWGQVLVQFGMVNNLPLKVQGGAIGYQFWSIAVEFQIYLLTPLLVAGVARWGLPAVIACALAVITAIVIRLPENGDIWFVALFLFGAGAARIIALHQEHADRAGWIGTAVVLIALPVILKNGNQWFLRNRAWVDLWIGAGAAGMIAGIACGKAPPFRGLQRLLSVRLLVWMGHSPIAFTSCTRRSFTPHGCFGRRS